VSNIGIRRCDRGFTVYAALLVSESSRMVGMREQRMSVAYSTDLRVRVIEAVKAGASRREAAECFGISVSSGIRWLREWLDGGRAAAKPRGGSCSPLEEHATWLLALIEKRPDLTLEEVVVAMGKQGIEGSRTAVWRFFKRHDVSFKKNAVRQRAKPSRCGAETRSFLPSVCPDADANARFGSWSCSRIGPSRPLVHSTNMTGSVIASETVPAESLGLHTRHRV
jgi:transposase